MLILISAGLLTADGVIPGVVNLEIKDEDNAAILSSTGLSCEVWFNDNYAGKVTLADVNIGFTTIGALAGILTIDAKALNPSSGPGDFLNIWVGYPTNQEGFVSIPLTDENTLQFVGPNALILTSEIEEETYGDGALTGTYIYNGYSRDINDVCRVTVVLPATSVGNMKLGLLSQKPGSVPSQGIDFGFYFDTKALTTLGSGNITVTVNWTGDIGLSGTVADDQGLYLSEDGIYWVNTKNVTYSGLSVYGTDEPDYDTSGQVSFAIDHIPHAIVFGNGATGTSSYTESTPPRSAGLTAAFDSDDLVLTWSESPQPGVSYDVQAFSGTWYNLNMPGSISGTTTKSFTIEDAATGDSQFYRTYVANNSEGSSTSLPMGFVKNTLAAVGWNMVGYSMGSESQTIASLKSDIGNSASIKIWDDSNQVWEVPLDSSTLSKGKVFLVDVNASSTWYSVGTAYPASGPYSYTLNYASSSGYNTVILPINKSADGIDTAEELYDDIFGSTRGTDSYPRTISWYDQSSGKYLTYDNGPITSSGFDSEVKVGSPFIIHIGSGDDNTIWPEQE